METRLVLHGPELPELSPEQNRCQCRGRGIGQRHAHPDPVGFEEDRERQQERHQEEQLAGEREKNRFGCHADRLEEIRGHHLEPDEWEHGQDDSERMARDVEQCRIVREEHRDVAREELADRETGRRDTDGTADHVFQGPDHPVDLPRAEVVAHDRLHPLVEPHDHHHEEHRDAVHIAVGADIEVSAVKAQCAVDEDHDDARTDVHQERRQADRQDAFDDAPFEADGLSGEVDEAFRVDEVSDLQRHGRSLCNDRRPGRSGDSPAEAEDENPVQDAVQPNGRQHERHGPSRITRCTEHVVESQVDVCDDISRQQNDHIAPGISDGVFAGAEESKDRVEQRQAHEGVEEADQGVENDDVPQDQQSAATVVLPHFDGEEGRRADADQRAECCAEVHERHGDPQSRQGQRTDAVADEDAVHEVVERRGGHGDDRRNRVAEQQGRYFFGA